MFDKQNYDLRLDVAVSRLSAIWASSLEGCSTTPFRMAGRVHRHINAIGVSWDRLTVNGIIGSLATVTRANYAILAQRASKAGAEKPRLVIHAYRGFVSKVQNRAPLVIGHRLRKTFEKLLEQYQVTWEPTEAPNHEGDRRAYALIKLGRRALVPDDVWDLQYPVLPDFVSQRTHADLITTANLVTGADPVE